jgi:periplasmic divalent cation tolerance protein
MGATTSAVVVLVTIPDKRQARRLARLAVGERAAACVQILPGIESHYRWKGRTEKSPEILLVCKTTRKMVPVLRRLVLANHPYETPQFVVLPVVAGTAPYLRWIADSVGPDGPPGQ